LGHHLSGAGRHRPAFLQSTRRRIAQSLPACCLTLLLKRFSVPRPSPGGRWALTPPFHPYPSRALGRGTCGRDHLKPPSYCYYGWFSIPGFPPCFQPGSFSLLPFRAFRSTNPLLSADLLATFSCGISCAQILRECCPPCGFLLSPRNKQSLKVHLKSKRLSSVQDSGSCDVQVNLENPFRPHLRNPV
jgi:hypothetical protein